MSNQTFDLVIIGSGPGGYVAAIRAKQLGLNVAVVEASHLGGICLNWGCIPTKALLRSAEVMELVLHASSYGIRAENTGFNPEVVVARSRDVASQLSKGVSHLLKKNKVEVIHGFGRLAGVQGGQRKVEVLIDNKVEKILLAKNVILATGARARTLPHLMPDGVDIWSYKEAMTPESMPKSLLVIGSGAIGIEFASFYRSMGAEVTVVEVLDRILPAEDEEISSLAQKAFEKRGIKIQTSTQVKSLTKAKKGIDAVIEHKGKSETQNFDKVIVSVGIVGNTENLGLENTKVKVEKDHVVINEWGETGESNVYAIGDLAGAPWLAHKASHEGIMVVERIAGHKVKPMKRDLIPGCTYSHPQVASVGLTEKQAKDLGHPIKVGRFPFLGNGKAIALGEPDGLVKTIFDEKTGELLGAHLIGAEVTELIQGFVIAKTAELTEADFMHTIFPHPTLSEMMHESTLAAYGRAIHI